MKRTGLVWVAIAAIAVAAGCSNANDAKTAGSEPAPQRGAAVGTGGAGADVKNDGEFVQGL
jgi:hypothetical protein